MDLQNKKLIGYHYTSVDVFMKLLDGIKDNNFVFYASSIFTMNDPLEFEAGYKLIWEQLPKIEDLFSIEPRYKLSQMTNYYNDGVSQNDFQSKILEMIQRSPKSPFVISYSRQRDFLPQWTLYGDDGKGVALGLNVEPYIPIATNDKGVTILDASHYNPAKPYALKVAYGKITKFHPIMNYLRFIYWGYYESVKNKKLSTADLANRQLGTLSDILLVAPAFLKNKAYKHEKESRIVTYKDKGQKIEFKTNSKGNITPYIETKVPVEYLNEVIIGPCCKDVCAIKLALAQKHLQHVNVISSQIPYR